MHDGEDQRRDEDDRPPPRGAEHVEQTGLDHATEDDLFEQRRRDDRREEEKHLRQEIDGASQGGEHLVADFGLLLLEDEGEAHADGLSAQDQPHRHERRPQATDDIPAGRAREQAQIPQPPV